jgi:hypothetical protein
LNFLKGLVTVVALLALSCSGDKGSLIVVTVTSSLPLSNADHFSVNGSVGERMRSFDVKLSSASIPPAASFAVELEPDLTGTFEAQIIAKDLNGLALAQAAGSTMVVVGGTALLSVTLGPLEINTSGDAGVDGGLGTDASATMDTRDAGITMADTLTVDGPVDTLSPVPDAAIKLDASTPDTGVDPNLFCKNNCTSCPCPAGEMCRKGSDCETGLCGAQNKCDYAESCLALHDQVPGIASGRYMLKTAGTVWGTYCEMVANAGGWTLILKQDSSSQLLLWSSFFWTSEALLSETEFGLEQVQAKLAGFSLLPFNSMRIGFSPPGSTTPPTEWIVVSAPRASLKAAITGPANVTWASVGRAAWLGLSPSFALAPNCTREGFNMSGTTRIGIVASASPTCDITTATSRIGFGGSGQTPSGNECTTGCAQEIRRPSFGYLMVR